MAKVMVDRANFHLPLYRGNKNFRKYKSHKFKAPALIYEVGIAIQSGDIFYICGPFPAGRWNDINIFWKGMKKSWKGDIVIMKKEILQ